MKTRDELLQSIATIVQDYREGEITRPRPEHVDRWARQFSNGAQLEFLTEFDHLLKRNYFSKKSVNEFFTYQIANHDLAKANPTAFWKSVNFLNIQQYGHSQREILALFADSIHQQCNLELNQCGVVNGPFFYLDDVLFSGGRVGSDLKNWIINTSPVKATVHVLVIGTHSLGTWQLKNAVAAEAAKVGKEIECNVWAAVCFENRKARKDSSEVLWPSELPDDEALASYMATESRFPFEPRKPSSVLTNPIFSNEAGRKVLEREFLLAGVKIRGGCRDPKKSMRPLGFSAFGLGFGSTIVTYRNCPNNCPLALWWGDANATSGAMHWYPLLPRKTYAQSDIVANCEF